MGSSIRMIDCPKCGGWGCVDDDYKEGVKITDCMDCGYYVKEKYKSTFYDN